MIKKGFIVILSQQNLLDVDFWLWYQKVTPKGMAHAFKIKFWETFSTPGYYDILTEGQYKMPNSNDGCMQLRALTACPEWKEGTNENETILVRGCPISHFCHSRSHPTSRLELHSALLFELELRSTPISELCSTFTSGVTIDMK